MAIRKKKKKKGKNLKRITEAREYSQKALNHFKNQEILVNKVNIYIKTRQMVQRRSVNMAKS